MSDHRYLANLFRLYLHAAALNLLVRLRDHVADPPPQNPAVELPREALAGDARRRFFNRATRPRSVGRGPRVHLAHAADQSGSTRDRDHATHRRPAQRQLRPTWEHYRQVSQQILDFAPPAPESG